MEGRGERSVLLKMGGKDGRKIGVVLFPSVGCVLKLYCEHLKLAGLDWTGRDATGRFC